MRLSIQTTTRLSNIVALEILSVAVNGACERWAVVTSTVRDSADWPLFSSATFSPIADPSKAMTMSTREIAAGIQRLLTDGYPCAETVKEKVLRIVANNDTTEVDTEAASSIVRAAMVAGAAQVADAACALS